MAKQVSKELENKFMLMDEQVEEFWDKQNWDKCIEIYWQMYDLLPEIKEEYEDVHLIFSMIGYLYELKQDIINAKKYYEKALNLSVYSGEYKLEMDAGINWAMGKFYFNEGNKKSALEYFALAFEFVDLSTKDKLHVEFVKENINKIQAIKQEKKNEPLKLESEDFGEDFGENFLLDEDSEDKEYVFENIIFQIKAGFLSQDEIEEVILDIVEGEDLEDMVSRNWVVEQIEKEFKKHNEEFKKLKRPTDTERLIVAFDELRKENIIALHNAGYTTSDGEDDVITVERELREQNVFSDGYCFYHQQDLESAMELGELWIAFQKVDNEDAEVAVNVGRKIVEVLKKHNFKVKWNEKVNEKISIKDFNWQLAYDENRKDLLDLFEVAKMILK